MFGVEGDMQKAQNSVWDVRNAVCIAFARTRVDAEVAKVVPPSWLLPWHGWWWCRVSQPLLHS